MKRFLLALLVLAPTCALAQNYVKVTAQSITDPSGKLVQFGTICARATDGSGVPIPFKIGGGGQSLNEQACGSLQNGAIVGTFSLANPATTSPVNIRYTFIIKNQSTGSTTSYSNVSIVNPASCGTGCLTWSFDNYDTGLNLPTIPQVQVSAAYTLPNATTSSLGGVQIGSGISVSNGIITVPSAASSEFTVTPTGSPIYSATANVQYLTLSTNVSGGTFPLGTQGASTVLVVCQPSGTTYSFSFPSTVRSTAQVTNLATGCTSFPLAYESSLSKWIPTGLPINF